MDFGRLAGNDDINARIYEHFTTLHPSDVPAFVRKLRSEADSQRFHTYRELILGAYLRRNGWNLRYGRKIDGMTPDWVLEDTDGSLGDILDVMTLHQRREIDLDISRGLAASQAWTGWITIPPEHILSKVQQKATRYSSLARRHRLPYVVAIFGEFTASVEARDVEHVVYGFHGGAFKDSPLLSGVIYFRERSGQYEFSRYPNAKASHASAILTRG